MALPWGGGSGLFLCLFIGGRVRLRTVSKHIKVAKTKPEVAADQRLSVSAVITKGRRCPMSVEVCTCVCVCVYACSVFRLPF